MTCAYKKDYLTGLKWVISMLLTFFIVFLSGCQAETTAHQTLINKNNLETALNDYYRYYKNIMPVGEIQAFDDHYLTVVSYDDMADRHYVDLVTFSVKGKNNEISILSHNGGAADPDQPLSYLATSGISNDKSYLITYGEVYDDTLYSIELEYDIGRKEEQVITNRGYLFIAEDSLCVCQVTAYNQNKEPTFSMP